MKILYNPKIVFPRLFKEYQSLEHGAPLSKGLQLIVNSIASFCKNTGKKLPIICLEYVMDDRVSYADLENRIFRQMREQQPDAEKDIEPLRNLRKIHDKDRDFYEKKFADILAGYENSDRSLFLDHFMETLRLALVLHLGGILEEYAKAEKENRSMLIPACSIDSIKPGPNPQASGTKRDISQLSM